eukprot:GHUV01023759.1.p1 GENE.GHUV01023759.1~~GHUV01023759.1.p1  ORF type:complete len:330 (+),score=44.48 GHUV01023759.1:373-1362(+)
MDTPSPWFEQVCDQTLLKCCHRAPTDYWSTPMSGARRSWQLTGSLSAVNCVLVLVCARIAAGSSACDASKFGPYIEGAAVNKQGTVFAVNGQYQRNVISYASESCKSFAKVEDKPGTSLNSIRVLPDGGMLSTDTTNARVVMVSADGKHSSTYCDGAGMISPNDLAITSRGYLYISGQRWTDNTVVGDGGVWLCKGPGQAVQLTLLGRTNGIEVSPDEKYLYVSEAFNKAGTPVSNKILRYVLHPDGTLGTRTVLYDFAVNKASNVDIDGMRTDTAGNLYVTRNQVSWREADPQHVGCLVHSDALLFVYWFVAVCCVQLLQLPRYAVCH